MKVLHKQGGVLNATASWFFFSACDVGLPEH